MQRPDPGVELLIGDFVLQPVQAVLPEVEFHSFLQLPFFRVIRQVGFGRPLGAYRLDSVSFWIEKLLPSFSRRESLGLQTTNESGGKPMAGSLQGFL